MTSSPSHDPEDCQMTQTDSDIDAAIESGNLDALGETVSENPTHIWIEPTNRCNTKCAHCGHFYSKFGEDMEGDLYRKILEQAADNLERVELIGYGEPLMARHFQEMFDEMTRRGVHVYTTSNGILLRKDEVVAKLVRAPMTLCLSIDGARKESFEWVRRLIKWERMIETLECIKRNADAAGDERRFRFRFNFVAMKRNIADLPGLVRLAHQYGAEEIFILPLGGEEVFDEMHGQSLRDSPELVSPAFMEALPLAAKLGVRVTVPVSFRAMIVEGDGSGGGLTRRVGAVGRRVKLARTVVARDGIQAIMRHIAPKRSPRGKAGVTYCSMPWRDAYFASDGTVFPCCIMGEKLGDMKAQEWEEVWNGRQYRNLRRTVHSWNPTQVCRMCPLPTGINGGDEQHHVRFFSKFRREPLPLDDAAVRLGAGFHVIERDAEGAPSHAWTAREGLVELPMRGGARFLRLLVIPRAPVHEPNPGRAVINGGTPEPFDNTCPEVHLPLDHVTVDTIRLELSMELEHRVPNDERALALAVRGFELLF
jgi:radical SAM protein with 4Fe4S-binding SPASM domain